MPSRASILFPLIVLAALALASCRDSGGKGDYFELDGKLFVFNYRVATATYLVNIKPVRPVGEGGKAVVRFEDPAGGEPIEVQEKIWPRLAKTTIQSPPLRCVAKDRPYAVSIRIEAADGSLLQTIETTMMSSENQADVLPDRPLVVGPGYDPNPELAGHPDGKLPEATLPAPPRPLVEPAISVERDRRNGRTPRLPVSPKVVSHPLWTPLDKAGEADF